MAGQRQLLLEAGEAQRNSLLLGENVISTSFNAEAQRVPIPNLAPLWTPGTLAPVGDGWRLAGQTYTEHMAQCGSA